MIIGHCIIQHPVNLFRIAWCGRLHWLTSEIFYNMPLFFFLSGYYYHCEEYGPYIRKKFLRVFLPYLIWAAVNDLLYVFGGSLVHETISLKEGIIAYLTGDHLWFLYTLFVVFLIYPWIEKIPYGSVALCAVCILLPEFCRSLSGQVGSVIMYLPFFIAGHLCHKHGLLEKGRVVALISDHPVGTFLVCVLSAAVIRYIYDISGSFFVKFIGGLPTFFGLYLITKLPTLKKDSLLSRVFIKMGQYSLQIYLLNFYIIPVMKVLVCRLLGIEDPLVIIVSFTLVCIIPVVFACDLVIKKSKFLRLAFGMP